jgi:hypothetical protein
MDDWAAMLDGGGIADFTAILVRQINSTRSGLLVHRGPAAD